MSTVNTNPVATQADPLLAGDAKYAITGKRVSNFDTVAGNLKKSWNIFKKAVIWIGYYCGVENNRLTKALKADKISFPVSAETVQANAAQTAAKMQALVDGSAIPQGLPQGDVVPGAGGAQVRTADSVRELTVAIGGFKAKIIDLADQVVATAKTLDKTDAESIANLTKALQEVVRKSLEAHNANPEVTQKLSNQDIEALVNRYVPNRVLQAFDKHFFEVNLGTLTQPKLDEHIAAVTQAFAGFETTVGSGNTAEVLKLFPAEIVKLKVIKHINTAALRAEVDTAKNPATKTAAVATESAALQKQLDAANAKCAELVGTNGFNGSINAAWTALVKARIELIKFAMANNGAAQIVTLTPAQTDQINAQLAALERNPQDEKVKILLDGYYDQFFKGKVERDLVGTLTASAALGPDKLAEFQKLARAVADANAAFQALCGDYNTLFGTGLSFHRDQPSKGSLIDQLRAQLAAIPGKVEGELQARRTFLAALASQHGDVVVFSKAEKEDNKVTFKPAVERIESRCAFVRRDFAVVSG